MAMSFIPMPDSSPRAPRSPRSLEAVLPSPTRTVTRCLVCGSREVWTDEVVDRGLLLLSECERCEHRWTERAERAPQVVRTPPASARIQPTASVHELPLGEPARVRRRSGELDAA